MKVKILLALHLMPLMALAQQPGLAKTLPVDSAAPNIFQLGEITVWASKNSEMMSRASSVNMESQNKMEVSKALNMLPGINLTASGARNESMVTVRGFDLRQMPVYMDGIPVYVPYDGYVDLSRFTTFDLSAIDVAKGFSSLLYGPNSLGGAINLISRKPVKKLEYDGSVGSINNNGYAGNINIGANISKFYFQGGYSYLHRDSYAMSANYDSTKNENGNQRDNSYRTDQKFNLKIGWAPNEKHEYVFGYINQHGKKGNPVYCGTDTLNSLLKKPRYWQWPYWNKETYYFLSKTSINSKNSIKTKFYYDIFKNSLNSYDDATYTTQKKPYAFQSFYNDYTYGGSVEYGTTIIPKNNLKLAVHYKEDIHRENNLNEPVRHFDDNTLTVGAENIYRATTKLVIIPGASYSLRKNIKAEDYNASIKAVFDFPKADASQACNGQLGIFYYLKENHKIGSTVSHKTRFATIKDRYSYRMGTAIPNPDLKPETADNYEVNYTGKFFQKFSFQTALFYSKITDAIMNISNILPGKSQMQNAGKAEFKGVEAAVNVDILKNLMLSANYTYIERHNLTNPAIRFTDVPNTKVFSYIQYQPIKQIQIIASAEYNSSRFSTSYGAKAGEFTLVNAIASVRIWKYLSIETGANNLFDKNYSLVEGYPEEGRNYFVTLRFFNHH
ncbi:MAG: TonB-dependent receptor [Bacteroidetes bacterium]|nr:TonB-dependent receptor [Bacteroidota bacterium]